MSLIRRDSKKARRQRGAVIGQAALSTEQRKARRREWLVKAGIFLALVVLTVAAFVSRNSYEYTVRVGDVWRQENLSAPFVFAIEKPPAVRKQEQQTIRETTPPFFLRDDDDLSRVQVERDSLAARLDRALELRARYQADRLRNRDIEATEDSLAFEAVRGEAGLPLTIVQWRLLSQSYNERAPGISTRSRAPSNTPRLDILLMDVVWPLVERSLEAGVTDVPLDSIRAPQVIVRNQQTRGQAPRPREELLDLASANSMARASLEAQFSPRSDSMAIAMAIFGKLLQPSLTYDRQATLNAWEIREGEISPNAGRVQVNEVIVRRGDVITPEIQQKILSLESALKERRGQQRAWQTAAGQVMLTLALYVWFFLYLYVLRRAIFVDNRMVLLIAILFALVVVMYGAAVRIPAVDVYMVPVAITGVLLTILFDSRVAIFALVTLAMLGSVLTNMDLVYGVSTLFSGTLGVFSVRDIRNRGQFFLSAGVVYLGYAIILLSAFLLESTSLGRFLDQLMFVGINAVLVLLAYGFLWVFERAFGLTTDVTLLELSDTNRPLLKELSLKAPGTFNHTLQVANLAEAAAAAIDANALLTRVGALYHDIGKMDKPEYFVENQRSGVNPHDQLKPRMSALIIASHVKEGLAIGESYGLPAAVTKFIPMHHGTTRIEYFYRRALDMEEEGNEVMESDFRYPGPRPDSKETAILMLADSVEAASRALENPTHKRLKSLIDGLVDSRSADHQLDSTDLTYRDLTQIKETFLNLLQGQFHVRVKYPGGEERAAGESTEGETSASADRLATDGEAVPAAKPIGEPDPAPSGR